MIKDIFFNEIKSGDLIIESVYKRLHPLLTFNIDGNCISCVYLIENNSNLIKNNKKVSVRNIRVYNNHCRSVMIINKDNLPKEYMEFYNVISKHIKRI